VNLPETFHRSTEEFDTRVRQISEDQWTLPTPCTEWNVRDLVNHLVNEDRWAKPLFDGKTIAEVGDALDGDLLGDAPKNVWSDARSEAVAAITAEGAMDRIVHVSFGDIPGSEYTMQLLVDHVIHAWDLARAIGVDEDLDPELVQLCYKVLAPQEQMLRGSGVYGDRVEVPKDASLQTKLLALVGRRA